MVEQLSLKVYPFRSKVRILTLSGMYVQARFCLCCLYHARFGILFCFALYLHKILANKLS